MMLNNNFEYQIHKKSTDRSLDFDTRYAKLATLITTPRGANLGYKLSCLYGNRYSATPSFLSLPLDRRTSNRAENTALGNNYTKRKRAAVSLFTE